jgi:hypothetical protein
MLVMLMSLLFRKLLISFPELLVGDNDLNAMVSRLL